MHSAFLSTALPPCNPTPAASPLLLPCNTPCSFRAPPLKPHRDINFLPGELQRRGGFVPLMHLFPEETPDGMHLIPWHPLDKQLRAWCRTKAYAPHASALHPACR